MMNNKISIKNINYMLRAKSALSVFMGTKLKDYLKVAAQLCGRKDFDNFDELYEFTRLDPQQRIYMKYFYPDCETCDNPNPDVTIGEMLHAAQALFRHEASLLNPEDYDDVEDLESLYAEMEDSAIFIIRSIFAPLAALAKKEDENKT